MARISIFGLGYGGCVGIGAWPSRATRWAESIPKEPRGESINSGRATMIEKHIERLLAEGHQAGRISTAPCFGEAVRQGSRRIPPVPLASPGSLAWKLRRGLKHE